MKISVAMCIYNGENFIESQILSINNQSKKIDELIICDDISTDNTVLIINRLIDLVDFKIKLFVNSTNLGSTKNFEKAITLTSGDIIFLADQDDIWHKDKVKSIVNIFKTNSNTGLVFTNAGLIDENNNKLSKKLWDIYKCTDKDINNILTTKCYKMFLTRNYATGATLAFNSSLKTSIIPIPKEWVHDHYIAFIASIESNIYPIDQCLTFYRLHSSQQIGVKNSGIINRIKNKDKMFLIEKNRLNALESIYHNLKLNENEKQNIKSFCDSFRFRLYISNKNIFTRFFLVLTNFVKLKLTLKKVIVYTLNL